MLFHSFAFAVFLPVVFILYWAFPHKFRWILLLAASYYFYMSWNVKYVLLILFTTAISYGAARWLEREQRPKRRKWILAGTAILCLGVLFFFKYFNFVSASVADCLRLFAVPLNPLTLNLLLPVGISFYTFQTLSYVIDVYKGDVPAERHFGYYAAFISFFPQLVAWPAYLRQSYSLWIRRTGNEEPGGCYSRNAFNRYGDVVYKPIEGQMDVDDFFKKTHLSVPEINDICINRINEFNVYCRERGATLVVAGYPIAYGKYSEYTKEDFREFQSRLEKSLDCEIISDYTDYFYPYEYFYDTYLHLNDKGAEFRTKQLISDLKHWMGR